MSKFNLSFNKLSKLSLYTFIFVTLVLGVADSQKVSAQMPNMQGMMQQMMGAMTMDTVASECRTNPGTGEVFCEVKMDISMMAMTQTFSPYEFYEGQGVWFQGCMLPGQQYENYEAAWIERQYIGPAASDPTQEGTHIFLRGNMPYEPGTQIAKCKYQFFLSDSPLVQPGGPYHNPQWEADQETQKMYEEADNIRREAERKRAEEELLRARQQAELELQMAEEMRKQQAAQNQGNNQGIGNIFGQGPVGNIFGNQFQPPPDNEVPVGPFINLTKITTEDRWKVMECIANQIESGYGMSYEQAYMDFAFPLGVRPLEEPDFYYESVINCMQLSFSKLLSGGWGADRQEESSTGTAPRADLNAMMEACLVPHLSDSLNIPRNVIMDDMVTVETGKRSISYEEMLAAYDCWYHWDSNIRPNPNNSQGYFPLSSDLLVTYIFGDQEIQGQACMIDSVADAQGMNRDQAGRIVDDLVNFAVGRSDQWGFLESDANPQHKNEVVNRVIGCNNELNWLRDYLDSVQGNFGGNNDFTLEFTVLREDWIRDCVLRQIGDDSGIESFQAAQMYEQIIQGMIDHEDPTEYYNRPLAEDWKNAFADCAEDMNGDELPMNAWDPYLNQYTVTLEFFEDRYASMGLTHLDVFNRNDTYDGLRECIVTFWRDHGFGGGKYGDAADDVIESIFFTGKSIHEHPMVREMMGKMNSNDSLIMVHDCLGFLDEFEWVPESGNPDYDYQPIGISDIFTSGGSSQKSATDFRQTIQTNDSNRGNNPGNMVQGTLSGGGALENMRIELVNMSRNSAAEDCMVANLARAKGETENYIKTSYMSNLVWDPKQRPSNKEKEALGNCESQIRTATQGRGGLDALLKLGRSQDPDYLAEPDDSQRACMINEYVTTFGYMIESSGGNPEEAAAKAVAEFSMPGTYSGMHPIVGDKAPNLRPASAIELDAISNCKLVDLYVYEGSRLRKLIPGVDTSDLPIGDIASPTGLAIVGIMITLFFSVLQMIRGK